MGRCGYGWQRWHQVAGSCGPVAQRSRPAPAGKAAAVAVFCRQGAAPISQLSSHARKRGSHEAPARDSVCLPLHPQPKPTVHSSIRHSLEVSCRLRCKSTFLAFSVYLRSEGGADLPAGEGRGGVMSAYQNPTHTGIMIAIIHQARIGTGVAMTLTCMCRQYRSTAAASPHRHMGIWCEVRWGEEQCGMVIQ